MPTENPELLQKILEIVRDVVKHDKELREQFVVKDKFRFVQDRLHALLDQLEKKMQLFEQEEKKAKAGVVEDEVLVFVYLYNAQGIVLRNWHNMLTPKVFYEYSVNRPIYSDKTQVEKMVAAKPNKVQHAFLTIAVKKEEVLQTAETTQRKDAMGNPLIKVKEGSLHFEKLVSFTHNNQEYVVNARGELVKKESES